MRNQLSALLLMLITNAAPAFASDNNCVACHAEQVASWQESDHAKAMDLPTEQSVLGNFDNATAKHFSQKARFYRSKGLFKIEFEEQGKKSQYQVAYTFGHYPLQQYLIETGNGKLQVFPFAWDSRPQTQGGQRWYPIYPDEDIQSADRLHWLQPMQNWNGMCADCHSDGLKRNYSILDNSFNSKWDNINVGCQSCHGKMPEHGNSTSKGSNEAVPHYDANTAIAGWMLNPGDAVAHWLGKKRNPALMDTCFSCHSLRSPLTDGFEPDTPYLDQFSPTLLAQPLYHADGQIKDEVYVYGSFLQSKMYQAGVNCMDCHNPHSMQVKDTGNGLCLQCHNPTVYQQESHTQHPLDSAGGQCINCHMPATTYMGVDARRDHSFKVPAPHLSDRYDTPNACSNCHQDKSNQWASEAIERWHGKPEPMPNAEHLFMTLQHSGNLPPADHFRLANSTGLSEIKRASAIALLPNSLNQLADADIQPWVESQEPLIRLATAKIGHLLPEEERGKSFARLINDRYRAIRVAAALHLIGLDTGTQEIQQRAFSELTEANTVSSWRGEGNLNRSLMLSRQGKAKESIRAMLDAIEVDPHFDASYINLSDTYRNLGQPDKERKTLAQGLENNPKSGTLHYAQGLLEIRSGNKNTSVKSFREAMRHEPDNERYAYLYFLALDSIGQTDKAQRELKHLVKRYRNNAQLIQLGLNFSQKLQDRESFQFFLLQAQQQSRH
ncbi:multiheme c-type cytochrome [Microbulbifer agarilyticus]|uniref:multiheme c-type cytochrome n=1 Tax=Microbulbifer agarilyticus TaxID=260552 RepID=UPI001CD61631|nr:multiheme c-type cytochrome [Microbulbifer agarilyticus]MCA0892170.1 hypothetical protein [Microbulbifer agarilyticus]